MQLSNLIGPFVPRDHPEKNDIGRLALTLTKKRQCQVELWQNRTVQGFRPIQRSNCCQSWMIRIAKTPKQANKSAIRIFEGFLVEKGLFKKDSFVKADSDAAAAGNAESERTRMFFLDFLYIALSILSMLSIILYI